MVDFHRLKHLGTDILGRAGDIAEQAKDKVVPLAEQAKDKVGPLAEQAKDKVGPLAGRAKDAAAKGVDKAAGGLDSATGHKYHHKLGAVTGNRDKNPTPSPVADVNETDPATPATVEPVTVEPVTVEPVSVEAATAEAATAEAATGGSATPDPTMTYPGAAGDAGSDPGPAEVIEDAVAPEHPTPADMPQHRAVDGEQD